HRGYCYLLLPEGRPLKDHAKQRLKALEDFSMLGAGFKIAMRDLEIRGAGNILGPEQSGHIAAVGYDMYCQLLDRAVKELTHEHTARPSETSIDIGISGLITRSYIPSDLRRLEAYRRIALCQSGEELARVGEDLLTAYGPPPPEVQRLLELAELRIGGRNVGVRSILTRDRDVVLRTTDPVATSEALRGRDASGAPASRGWTVTTLPPKEPGQTAEVYFRPENPEGLAPATLMAVLRRRLGLSVPAPTLTLTPTPATTMTATTSGKATPPATAEPVLAPVKKPAMKAPPPLSASLKALRKEIRRK
nr:hypothetical protein [Phycisphaerales bacterium]